MFSSVSPPSRTCFLTVFIHCTTFCCLTPHRRIRCTAGKIAACAARHSSCQQHTRIPPDGYALRGMGGTISGRISYDLRRMAALRATTPAFIPSLRFAISALPYFGSSLFAAFYYRYHVLHHKHTPAPAGTAGDHTRTLFYYSGGVSLIIFSMASALPAVAGAIHHSLLRHSSRFD